MCNFLSAIVLRNGDIVCDPEHTDSHEDLIESRGLIDSGRGGFVRVEFTPGDDVADTSGYSLGLDEQSAPDWWTDAVALRVADSLRERVRRMIVDDSRKLLLGGCWIVCGSAIVGKARSCRIIHVGGSATIDYVGGSATIDCVCGSAAINRVYDSATINYACDSATINHACDSATINHVCDSATIIRPNAEV